MARFSGRIGYAQVVETAPGVFRESYFERLATGTLSSIVARPTAGETTITNLQVTNIASVVLDAYIMQQFHNIRYIWWNGVKWRVSSVEVKRPRLNIAFSEVFHDQ